MQIEQINLREKLQQVRRSFDARLAEALGSRPHISQARIKKEFGISDRVIRRVMKEFNISPRRRGPKSRQLPNGDYS